MEFKDLEIGMEVEALEGSNDAYAITTQILGCKGIVTGLYPKYEEFELRITEHEDLCVVGNRYGSLCPKYFDKKNGLNVKLIKDTKKPVPQLGDLMVFESGAVAMLTAGVYSGEVHRAVILKSSSIGFARITEGYYSLDNLIEALEGKFGVLVKVIPKESFEIKEIA